MPYTNADLRRNFLSIALRAEAADDVDGAGEISHGQMDARRSDIVCIQAGPRDYVQVAGVTSRLRLLTGLDIDRAAPWHERPNVEV